MAKHSHDRGFTLIELLVVVAIIAIIAAIALPAYSDFIKASKARTAQADLRAWSAVQEGYRQRTLAYPADETIARTGFSPASKSGDFTFSHATTGGYTLTATGVGSVSGCPLALAAGNVSSSTGACWGAVQGDGKW